MKAAIAPQPIDDDIRMGSEYADARTYLSRSPRAARRSSDEVEHGSNDSDFGVPIRDVE